MHTKRSIPDVHNTWVFVELAERLPRGAVRAMTMMGRDLVLWRGASSGDVSLMDAYCPHMGAHLGRGEVKKDRLVCHFHKRSFGLDGGCGRSKRPLTTYPLVNQQGMIFAWFGEDAPTWEMPPLLTGTPWAPRSQWQIFRSKQLPMQFHPQDLLDNTMDPLHFKTFHNQCRTFEPPELLEVSEHVFKAIVRFKGHPRYSRLKIPYEIDLETETFGPCTLVVNGNIRIAGIQHFMKFLFLCAPEQGETTNYTLALAVMTPESDPVKLPRRIFNYALNSYSFVLQLWEFYVEGKQIWESKTYLEDPDLARNEHTLETYHDWYRKYYVASTPMVPSSDAARRVTTH